MLITPYVPPTPPPSSAFALSVDLSRCAVIDQLLKRLALEGTVLAVTRQRQPFYCDFEIAGTEADLTRLQTQLQQLPEL